MKKLARTRIIAVVLATVLITMPLVNVSAAWADSPASTAATTTVASAETTAAATTSTSSADTTAIAASKAADTSTSGSTSAVTGTTSTPATDEVVTPSTTTVVDGNSAPSAPVPETKVVAASPAAATATPATATCNVDLLTDSSLSKKGGESFLVKAGISEGSATMSTDLPGGYSATKDGPAILSHLFTLPNDIAAGEYHVTITGTCTKTVTITVAPPADTTSPTVSNVQPTGTISSGNTTLSADYSDAGSGINTASVSVYLDGGPVSGCTVTASSVSCPLFGLLPATHNISVSVKDNAGNTGTGTGSFTVPSPHVGSCSISAPGLTPNHGVPGDKVAFAGTFDASGSHGQADIIIKLDGVNQTFNVSGSSYSGDLTIPSDATAGAHSVSARLAGGEGCDVTSSSTLTVDAVDNPGGGAGDQYGSGSTGNGSTSQQKSADITAKSADTSIQSSSLPKTGFDLIGTAIASVISVATGAGFLPRRRRF